MRGKKSVVLLGVAVLVATIIVAVIDATMIVRHEITPKEKLPFGLLYWLMKGPWWWIVVPIILGLITSMGLAAFLLGRGCKLASMDLWGLVLVSLTPVIILISGLFDLVSATCIEYLRSRNPLQWMNYGKWWWTAYHPYPRLSSTLMGRSYCTWIDMLAGSLAGAALLAILWLYWGLHDFAPSIDQ